MPRNLNAEEKRVLATQAYKLMLARATHTEIGKQLGIDRKTAGRLIKEEMLRLRAERGSSETEQLAWERDRAVDTYDEVIRAAWQKFRDPNLAAGSLNQSGYLNTIVSAQSNIAKIYGLESLLGSDADEALDKLTAAFEDLKT